MPFEKDDPNINRKGRTPGSTNKTPTVNQFKDKLYRQSQNTLNTLITIRDGEKTSDATKIKVSKIILDAIIAFYMEDIKDSRAGVEKPPKQTPTGKEESQSGTVAGFSSTPIKRVK